MNKLRAWLRTYTDELVHKVQWPSVSDLQSSTVTVLVASLLIALLIFVMDVVFGGVIDLLSNLFNG